MAEQQPYFTIEAAKGGLPRPLLRRELRACLVDRGLHQQAGRRSGSPVRQELGGYGSGQRPGEGRVDREGRKARGIKSRA